MQPQTQTHPPERAGLAHLERTIRESIACAQSSAAHDPRFERLLHRVLALLWSAHDEIAPLTATPR